MVVSWNQEQQIFNNEFTFVEGTDISRTIQRMLYQNYPVWIPRGYYYLDYPILFPYVSGSLLRGVGRSDLLIGLSGSRLDGYSTRLRYRDITNTGQPCITLQGSDHNIGNFTLLAETPNTSVPPTRKKDIGILLDNTGGTGLGSGNANVDGVGFYSFKRGLQIGTREDGYNNDLSHWSRLVFRNCGSCVSIRNTMAMEHNFYKCKFLHEIDYAFDIAGGGHQTIEKCDVLNPLTFIRFNGLNQKKYRTGPNNRKHKIRDLKVDSQATRGNRPFYLIETTHNNKAWVEFEDLQVSGNNRWAEGNYSNEMRFRNIRPSYASSLVTPAVASFDLPN